MPKIAEAPRTTPREQTDHDSGAIHPDPDRDRSEREFYLSEEWALACRVAASKGLSKSSLLPKFLLHICEQSLKGKSRELTEQRIGTSIFNRATNYNPGEDNIVRSYARTLRRRLDEYFEADGNTETIRIVIPRGGYVPTFEPVVTPNLSKRSEQIMGSSGAERPPVLSPHASAMHESKERRWAVSLLLAGFLAGTLICVGLWAVLGRKPDAQTQSPSHLLWAELFRQNHNTLIVPADSGFGILQNLSHRTVSLQEYANGSYFSDSNALPGVNAGSIADLRQQRYTSVADLNITSSILQLPESSNSRTEIRYARNITTEDLKTFDVILLGSVHSNPWVALFEDKLNFTLKYLPEVNQSFVSDHSPSGNEQKQYLNDTGTGANGTYGVIDYLPNLDGNGHVLIIQGLNMAATQAAADTLFHTDAMSAFLHRALRPNGTLKPFELLIKTSSIGATDPGSEIIATRIYE